MGRTILISPRKSPRGGGPAVTVAMSLIEAVRFASDSPLEGDGFEPSVPPVGTSFFETRRNPPTTGSQNRILTVDKGRFTVAEPGWPRK